MKTLLLAAGFAVFAIATLADNASLNIEEAYARSGPKSGAVFFMIENTGTTDDRLIGASTDIAKKVELHTHLEDANGVMKMREIEGGIPIAAGEGGMAQAYRQLARGLIQGGMA